MKDFSRFGRDYLEVGFYIEYIFPLLQIRFISINDSYDSAASSGMTGGMNVALKNLVYNMYSLDLSKKISSAMQTRTKNSTRLPVNARYGYKKGKDGRLEVDPDTAKVVKMIFQMAAEGMSFAEITRDLNRQEIATCDEQKISRGEHVQFRRFDTIKKKRWNPTTVSAIIRDEIYIGTRIWGKSRCNMHTGHKAVLNDEADWIRLENHHDPIVDRELFEKANRLHPKKSRGVAETRTNYTLTRRKKQPALMLCAHCGHCLARETEHLLKCSDGRTSGDHPMLIEFIDKILIHERDIKGAIDSPQTIEIYFNFIGKFEVPKEKFEQTPEEIELAARKERLRQKRHDAYVRRKETGRQSTYYWKTRRAKKEAMDAMKEEIRAEDQANGVYYLPNAPKKEPQGVSV